jgi:NAD(P)-dependent dehydrogenase (short-subunit alcohol dehydrogenase family)
MPGKLPEVLERLGLEPDLFHNQVALVTGAGRGIGREIALAFAYLGAHVVIAEITKEGKVVEQVIRKTGREAFCVQTDRSDQDSVNRLKQAVLDTYGAVDLLINNAILCPTVSVLDMEVEQWDQVMGVNLRGAFLTCKAFLPRMLKRGSGVIVNMVSTEAMPFLSAYIASKQGLSAFSRSLAAEVGESGVKVVAFAPGFVATPGLESVAAQLGPNMGLTPEQFLNLSLHPAYPGAMPVEDAAGATVYLAARLASEFHGEVSDGYTILERAGYLQSNGEVSLGDEVHDRDSQTVLDEAGGRASVQRTLDLCRKLSQVICETEAEFQKLPVFVRPMARGGFKSKSGGSLADWKRGLDELCSKFHQLQTGNPSDGMSQQDIIRWTERFEKLRGYYQGVPAETARFTKDPELMEEIGRISGKRLALIASLQAELSSVFD